MSFTEYLTTPTPFVLVAAVLMAVLCIFWPGGEA